MNCSIGGARQGGGVYIGGFSFGGLAGGGPLCGHGGHVGGLWSGNDHRGDDATDTAGDTNGVPVVGLLVGVALGAPRTGLESDLSNAKTSSPCGGGFKACSAPF